MSKVYKSRRTFHKGDRLLWNGKRWEIVFEYPSKNWFDELTAYCVVPVGGANA